jgi:radical SAM superfamily enzyme YgiQ (UPF0313 family)
MPNIEPIIRPPAEAESILIQVTTGCSSNSCTFCGAYMQKPFRIKDRAEIEHDIRRAAGSDPAARRVFLIDGDALVIPTEKLIPILQTIQEVFPHLARIASYVNGYNITTRSDQELTELYRHKLRLAYIGLESGSEAILEACHKRSRAEEMITAVKRLEQAGIKSSVIVLLGLGGKERSAEHVEKTITALNRMQPRYLSFLSVMLIPGTPLYEDARKKTFTELGPHDLLREARSIIAGLELKKTVFRTDHASNYRMLEGRFPHDKTRLLETLDEAIKGNRHLRPEFFRGL